MHVALFSILEHLSGTINLQPHLLHASRKKTQNKKFYYLVDLGGLPEIDSVRGIRILEPHLTIYQEQSQAEGYLSAYHFTCIGSLPELSEELVKIRFYFDRYDELCLTPQVWRYNSVTKEQGKLLRDFFTPQQAQHLSSSIIHLVEPVVIELRRQQALLTQPLEAQYKTLLGEMEHLSLSVKEQTDWTKETSNLFKEKARQCVSLLQGLRYYLNQPAKEEAFIDILQRYQTLSFDSARQDDSEEPDQAEPAGEAVAASTLVPAVTQTKEQTRVSHELQELISKNSSILCIDTPLSLTQVPHDMISLMTQLDKLNRQLEGFWSKSISEQQAWTILQMQLKIRQKITDHAICLLSQRGNQLLVEPYYIYIRDIPLDVIEIIIKSDDAATLSSLLKHGILTENSPMRQGTVKEFAYEEAKYNCIQLLISRGCAPVSMCFNKMLKAHQSDSPDVLGAFCAKMMRLNQVLLGFISVPEMLQLTDSTIAFLTEQKQKASSQASALSPRKAFTAKSVGRRGTLFSAAQRETPVKVIPSGLIDFHLEICKFCKHLFLNAEPRDAERLFRISMHLQDQIVSNGSIMGMVEEGTAVTGMSSLFSSEISILILTHINRRIENFSTREIKEFATFVAELTSCLEGLELTNEIIMDELANLISIANQHRRLFNFEELFVQEDFSRAMHKVLGSLLGGGGPFLPIMQQFIPMLQPLLALQAEASSTSSCIIM